MKSSLFKFIFSSTVILLLAVACTTDVLNPGREDGAAVRISAEMGKLQKSGGPATQGSTRAANSTWETGDVIGVTMVKPGSFELINPYRNYGYKTSGDGSFSPNDATQIIYFPTSDGEVTFRAYYPYDKNLAPNLLIPVSTEDQSSLADIDLMTAEHLSGNSTADPNVKFHFYHRLAKVVVNLTTDNESISILNGVQLTMGGQKIKANYDLIGEELIVDNNAPDAAISIPVSGAKGEAIVLPRPAGSGVEFKITTTEGRTYTAAMSSDLELQAGYIHTFNIRLKSDVEISATIEPWETGPERHYDAVHLVTGLGITEGFETGHELDLFLKEGAAPDFGLLRKYTLDGENKWIPASPAYWESIAGSPAIFRGATVYEDALNNTQMPDILVSKDIEVAPFKGINLELEHAGSKVNIVLQSSDGTYTNADLEGATVVLPGYLNSGAYDPDTGEFIPGTTTGDISPEEGVAIFPPQTINNGNNLLVVAIDGREYPVKVEDAAGFEYEKAHEYTFVVDARKANVELSTVVTPWIQETREFNEIRVGPANLDNNGGDLVDGDELYLFAGDNTDRSTLPGKFVYNDATDEWTYEGPSAPLYWEDITDEGNLYASITRPAMDATAGNNQSRDYITATPIANNGGTDNTALNFKMEHKVARVNVMLRSSTYEEAQLLNANVTLPNYAIGGGLDKGIYVPGTGVGPISLAKPEKTSTTPDTYTTSSFLQPQTIALGQALVTVEIEGRIYTVKPEELIGTAAPVEYEAGKATNLIITIEKTGLSVSVVVTPWSELPAIEFEALFFSVTNKASAGFENNDEIKFYKLNTGGTAVEDINKVYQYTGGPANGTLSPVGTPWYRDDFQTGDLITAVYPSNAPALAAGESSFSWTAKSSGVTNAHADDLMIAAPVAARNLGEIQANGDVEFEFKHVLSKVTINLIVGEGFTPAEIMLAAVAMNNFQLTGTVDAIAATATPTGAATASFNPTKLGTPNAVTGKTVVSSYEAFVMPQTIAANTMMVTVTFGDGTFQAQLPAERLFAAGAHNTLNLTLNKTGAVLTASIVDWNHEGPIDLELH